MLAIQIVDPISRILGEWSSYICFGSVIFRLIIAILIGFVIGIERSASNHAAGLRTYIIVSLGATIAMMTGQYVYETFGTGDAARLGAQVISGIGFLGAGTIILTSKNQIRGLTTAAGLWACACTGLATGVGFYTLAILGALAIVLAFTILHGLEGYFKNRSKNFTIHIELDSTVHLKDLLSYIRKQNIAIQRLEANQAFMQSGLAVYTIYLENKSERSKDMLHIPFISDLKELSYVNFVEEIS